MEEDKKIIEQVYDRGFLAACESIIKVINLIPGETLSKDHVIKLIGIVHRLHSEEKKG